jgi:hypothetical protein
MTYDYHIYYTFDRLISKNKGDGYIFLERSSIISSSEHISEITSLINEGVEQDCREPTRSRIVNIIRLPI